MSEKFTQKLLTILLTILLSPLIAAYCLLWVVMSVGGGIVKRFFKKKDMA